MKINRNLPPSAIKSTVRYYGLPVHVWRPNAEQAISYHGKSSHIAMWGTVDGHYDAKRLLEGYLASEALERYAESMAANRFQRDAYGND